MTAATSCIGGCNSVKPETGKNTFVRLFSFVPATLVARQCAAIFSQGIKMKFVKLHDPEGQELWVMPKPGDEN